MKELNLQEIQTITLDILKEFDVFCRKHDLTYYLAWGTLIGAVRHGGFIPWDDDIDVFMTRPDFERFQKEYIDNGIYKLYSIKRQKEYYYTHMKLCNTRTYQVLPLGETDPRGVDIDIFALDGQDGDVNIAKNEFDKLHKKFIKNILEPNRWRYLPATSLKNKIRLMLVSIGVKSGILNLAAQRLDKAFSKRDYEKSERVGATHALFSGSYLSWDKAVFDDVIEMKFEDTTFYAPKNYDTILRVTYGDYMQLPPKEKRKSTHQEKYYLKQ